MLNLIRVRIPPSLRLNCVTNLLVTEITICFVSIISLPQVVTYFGFQGNSSHGFDKSCWTKCLFDIFNFILYSWDFLIIITQLCTSKPKRIGMPLLSIENCVLKWPKVPFLHRLAVGPLHAARPGLGCVSLSPLCIAQFQFDVEMEGYTDKMINCSLWF